MTPEELDPAWEHVNNVLYFHWIEAGRLAFCDAIGWRHGSTGAVGPIVGKTECIFRREVQAPDDITVFVDVEEIGEDRFTLVYRLTSGAQGGAVVATGRSRLVAFDYQARTKAPLPAVVRAALTN